MTRNECFQGVRENGISIIHIRVILFAVFVFSSICPARIITVDDDGIADFNTIQAAIDDANDGDIVEVMPGTYTGTGNRDIDFLGKAITLRSIDPNNPEIVQNTIIDCNGTELVPHRGFYFHHGENANSIVDGLTITKAYAPNDIFIDGVWRQAGAGACCYQSSPTFLRCEFVANSAPTFGIGNGAAIFTFQSSSYINKCYIHDNIGCHGPGIAAIEGNLVITDCTINNNQGNTNGSGGGIFIKDSTARIDRCNINNNKAGRGGGLYSESSSANVINSLFTGNQSQWCICCTFGGNNVITNCTIVRNKYNSWGSAVKSWTNGVVTVSNCICFYNSDGSDGKREVDTASPITYCNIYGGLAGEGNIDIDPNFAFENDFHLLADSFCIDAANNVSVPDWADLYDLENCNRFHDDPTIIDTGNGTAPIVDMGAYEYNHQIPRIAVSTGNMLFEGVLYGPDPNEQKLQIRNCGGDNLSWSIHENCGWLVVDPNIGSSIIEINDVNVIVDINGLEPGQYNTYLTIVDPNANNSPFKVHVTLTMSTPQICISKNEFTFISYQEDISPNAQTLEIRNTGGGTLNWTISHDCDWLDVSPLNGSSSGDINMVTLTPDITEIEKGQYDCNLIITDPCASNSPLIVRATLIYRFDNDGILYVPSEYTTIQEAIEIALDGNTVLVEDGTYSGDGNRDIDFLGKAIMVKSLNGPENCIIDCNASYSDNHRGFYFQNGEGNDSVLEGITITNAYVVTGCYGGAAIYCYGASPTIKNCIIRNNGSELDPQSTCFCHGGAIYLGNGSGPTISHCTITENTVGSWGFGAAVCVSYDSGVTLTKSLIAKNDASQYQSRGGGIYAYMNAYLSIDNCTFADNTASVEGGAIYFEQYNDPIYLIMFNSILWGNSPDQFYTPGTDNGFIGACDIQDRVFGMSVDPLFANPSIGDYHLKSQAGRWNPVSQSWQTDTVTSLCIDAGLTITSYEDELWPHGQRVNIGAHGGTAQASMSLSTAGNIADLDCDDDVDNIDLSIFTNKWTDVLPLLKEDLDRNGTVDFNDFAVFASNWW